MNIHTALVVCFGGGRLPWGIQHEAARVVDGLNPTEPDTTWQNIVNSESSPL